MPKFGPINTFAFWFDRTARNLEKKSSEFGNNYTLVSLFSRIGFLKSPRFLGYLSSKLDCATVESAKKLKILDNSSLLFYSPNTGRYLARIKFWEFLAPVGMLCSIRSTIPFYAFTAGLILYQPLATSAGRLFVVRMDLLPHMESIMFHKVGRFGTSVVEIVPIKNLKKTKIEHSKYDYYFRLFGGVDLLYQNTETGEEYAFEEKGVWMDDNLKHSLIN